MLADGALSSLPGPADILSSLPAPAVLAEPATENVQPRTFGRKRKTRATSQSPSAPSTLTSSWLQAGERVKFAGDCSGLEVAWEALADLGKQTGVPVQHQFSSDKDESCRRRFACNIM